ncbi:lysophospholipase D GDPD1 [Acipenser ruthenus]|uniref:lysophospholipase D GDPD1 n=1 Tax=Acipenser ruthenus TaxID=7906 RepID=UPI0027405CF3|nr:lysophospholipase D GDPD1 [Acipenser ruthenus]
MSSSLYYVVPILGGYALTSVVLFKNPHLLHRKKQTAFYSRHISHRGGAGERIENTLEAFTNAVDNNTDLLELDCHMTQDSQVVVSHDENLLRQTGHNVNISDVNYCDLPKYKDRLEVTFHTGHYSTGTDRQIALLEQVFQKFPKVPVNLEIKEDNEALIKKVSDLVKLYRRDDITVWASVKSHIMKKCRQANPSMPVMFTVQRCVVLLLLYFTGLLPFVPLSESFLQGYLPSIINRTFIPCSPLLRNKFVISVFEKILMQRPLFRHLQARGIQVHLFVLNEESEFRKAFDLGATGVMTDYPTKLRRYLDNNPPPEPSNH